VVKCINRCTGFTKVNPSIEQTCLYSCNLSLRKDIEETLARMPVFKDLLVPVERDNLYRDGLLLKNELSALKTAISQDKRAQPGNPFGSLFSNLGLFQSNPFAGSAQPSLGMFFLSNFSRWDLLIIYISYQIFIY
jgi:hypothetical protein